MGVDLKWEDENGRPLGEVDDPASKISALVLKTDLTWSTCLRFIDPYGDTTFSRIQIPILIDELRTVLGKIQDNRIKDHLQKLIDLAEQSRDEVHTYLKFYGD